MSFENEPQEPNYIINDEVLKFFLDWVNRLGLSIGISLQIGGTWIAGELVSESEYIHALAEVYANKMVFRSDTGVSDDVIRQARLTLNEIVLQLSSAQNTEITHLHLKNFFFVYPVAKKIPSDLPYCRVKLDDISAWIMGDPEPPE